jgi:hypothetical protein
MKKLLLAGVAALFWATGTVAAVEQNWEMAIVLKEPGKEPMLYRGLMLTREDCSQILSDARRQMAESRLPTSPRITIGGSPKREPRRAPPGQAF